jgi:hypothetical protein
MGMNVKTGSQLYAEILETDGLSAEVKKDLTLHLVFVVLLHVVNEKELHVRHLADGDFDVSAAAVPIYYDE